jgi:hypothetical protein
MEPAALGVLGKTGILRIKFEFCGPLEGFDKYYIPAKGRHTVQVEYAGERSNGIGVDFGQASIAGCKPTAK